MPSPEKFTTDYAYSEAQVSSQTSKSVPKSVSKALASTVPPHNIEVEQMVLGALILERDAFPSVSEILRPECFYDTRNRYVYEAIQQLALDEKPIDAQTVVEQLKLDGKLQVTDGLAYVATLSALVNSTAHLEFHARLLFDKMLQRDLISFGNSVINNAFDESNPVTDTMADAESRLFEITQGADKDDVQHVSELLKGALKDIEQAAEREEGISGIYTGFREIDEMTSGWHPSDLVILAARPGMGKTAFVLSMARAMAVDYGIPVAIFSLEMSKGQLINRLIVNHTEVPNDTIKRGKLTSDQMQQIVDALPTLERAPIYIDDNAGLSVFDLRSKARRLVRENGVKLIVIDYLQLMTASGLKANANREQEVSTISRSLKQLAKELNITVIALSQLNRSVESRPKEGKRPQLSDLRESGAIEQDADMVCFIHRPEYYGIIEDEDNRDVRGLAEFIIAKHRNGQIGSKYLRFQDYIIKFSSALDHEVYNDNVQTFSSRINESPSMGAGNRTGDPILDSMDDGGLTV
ncbi:replicative DNA helicase [Porphyromonadaceae bacterium W3.11]|nr:replicative DNA helicase [Porphyromonadaceae bacterium W3.11]